MVAATLHRRRAYRGRSCVSGYGLGVPGAAASNVIYEVPEGRPFWKLRPLQLLITLVMVVMLALLALALVLTGPVAEAVADPLGIGDAAVTAWDIAKWTVMLFVALAMVAVLYYMSPNARLRGFRWITPGSAFAVCAWLLASAAFAYRLTGTWPGEEQESTT